MRARSRLFPVAVLFLAGVGRVDVAAQSIDESVFLSSGWRNNQTFLSASFPAWWRQQKDAFDPDFEAEYDLAP